MVVLLLFHWAKQESSYISSKVDSQPGTLFILLYQEMTGEGKKTHMYINNDNDVSTGK